MTTSDDVAQWMFDELSKNHQLPQEKAITTIMQQFGNQFVRQTDIGGLAIEQKVLRAFRKKIENAAVWDSSSRGWRWTQS